MVAFLQGLDPAKLLEAFPNAVMIMNGQSLIIYANYQALAEFSGNVLRVLEGGEIEITDESLLKLLQGKHSCLKRASRPLISKWKPSHQKVNSKIYNLNFSRLDNMSDLVLVVFADFTREEQLRKRLENLRRSVLQQYPGKVDENVLFKRLSEAVRQSANTIVITNTEGNIVFANPKFEETTGYTINEVFGKNPRFLKSGDQPPAFYLSLWQTISAGNVWNGEFRNKKKSGHYYWESAVITPIKDTDGNITEYLAIKEDITERKLIEEKLEKTLMEMEVSNWEYKMLNEDLKNEVEHRKRVESELKLQQELLQELNENLEYQIEMEVKKNREKDELLLLQSRQAAMGEMIGNIAHQWRQPLNTIGLIVYDLTDAFRFGEIDEEYINKSEADIKAVLAHMSQTIDDFRNFFKPNKEKQTFWLSEVVKTSLSFLEATLRNSGIKLTIEVDGEIVLYGYPSEFAQVLLNLINNSKDALTENNVENPGIRVSGKKEGDAAVVKVIDNGGGIRPPVIHKIFDPYFTTKAPGYGTGVGLYMSKTIIERNMGGTITAGNVRKGAEFTIKVPLSKVEMPLSF